LPKAFGTGAEASGAIAALELLLVGEEAGVGSGTVARQGEEAAGNLEGGAVEVRRLGDAFHDQGHAAEVFSSGHVDTLIGAKV
jgi:hypothetical protein